MNDIEIELEHVPGRLAALGEALGAAGISVEGGGAFLVAGRGNAHFLVRDGNAARLALATAGIEVKAVRNVIVQRLAQDKPGQLGAFCRCIGDAGVNIEVLYSDHDNQLIVAVDDEPRAIAVSTAWMAARSNG